MEECGAAPVKEWGKYAGQREMLKWDNVTEAAGNRPWSSATRMAFRSHVSCQGEGASPLKPPMDPSLDATDPEERQLHLAEGNS